MFIKIRKSMMKAGWVKTIALDRNTWLRFRNLCRFLISLLNGIINERFFIEKPYFRFEKNCDKILAAEANR